MIVNIEGSQNNIKDHSTTMRLTDIVSSPDVTLREIPKYMYIPICTSPGLIDDYECVYEHTHK
jgi:hypothetical protein